MRNFLIGTIFALSSFSCYSDENFDKDAFLSDLKWVIGTPNSVYEPLDMSLAVTMSRNGGVLDVSSAVNRGTYQDAYNIQEAAKKLDPKRVIGENYIGVINVSVPIHVRRCLADPRINGALGFPVNKNALLICTRI